jgi:hypothetical protein
MALIKVPLTCPAAIARGLARRWHRDLSFWLAFLIPCSVILTSCNDKHAGPGQTESPSAQTPNDAAVSPPPATSGPTVTVTVVTYQTQITPNQYASPPGMRMPATRGEEIRYLDLASNRVRLEKYVFDKSGKRLYNTLIMDQTGSYSLDPAKNEAAFTAMTTPVPVRNFDQNVNTAWARERGLTVKTGEWLGRPCDIVYLASAGDVWLWHDIPLKREVKSVTSDMTIEAYRIQENVPIADSLLQVPAGMKVNR